MSAALTPTIVPFHGDELLTVLIDDTPHVPMKPIVEALGLTWSRQCKKIARNNSYGHKAIPLQTKSGIQDMLCIPLKKLNGWLFGINPNRVRPEIRAKLVSYQEECLIVLSDYWQHGRAVNPRMEDAPPPPDPGAPTLFGHPLQFIQIQPAIDPVTQAAGQKRAEMIGNFLSDPTRHPMPPGSLRHILRAASGPAAATEED